MRYLKLFHLLKETAMNDRLIRDIHTGLTKNVSNFDITMTTVSNINWQGITDTPLWLESNVFHNIGRNKNNKRRDFAGVVLCAIIIG